MTTLTLAVTLSSDGHSEGSNRGHIAVRHDSSMILNT